MDLVIRNGTVIDGTGVPGFGADVGIDGGRIVAIGEVNESGVREIDAEGLVVAPGFIDVHVHYDAQVLWDPSLSPSTLHGVSTMIGGNCGFTLGQAGPEEAEYLLRMLARVEGIPLQTLEAAVEWDWVDTAGYLDRIETQGVGPNIGFLAGHSTIRRQVMGERAVGGTATDAEIEAMSTVLRGALEAGALGFSSSFAGTHYDGEGDPVPSRFSNEVELFRLCEVTGEFEGTTLEHIPIRGADEIARMTTMSLLARRPLNWNVLQVAESRIDEVRRDLAASDHARSLGAVVRALTLPALSVQRLSFLTGFIYDSLPGWDSLFKMPTRDRIAALGDPVVRTQLQHGAVMAGPRREELRDWGTHLVAEATSEQLRPLVGRSIGDIARERGTDPFDTLIDLTVSDDLNLVTTPRPVGDDDESWALRGEVWRSESVLLGASDAGAHMDLLATFGFTTTLLAEGVRDRGLLSVEEAVRLITDWPARHYGLAGRGRLAEGWAADVVVFDPATVGPGQVSTRYDLPAGAGRLFSEAEGIECLIVNGRVLTDRGRHTGELPGRLLRSGQDTTTVLPPAFA